MLFIYKSKKKVCVCVCVWLCPCSSQTHEGYFVSPAAPPGFDELTCHCGASVIYPPVPCGTRPPECTQTCARIHECDHPGVFHLLTSTPYSLLTPCYLGCCMTVFTVLRSCCGGNPCCLGLGGASVKVCMWSGPELGIATPSTSLLCGCQTHVQGWEKP